MSVAGAILCPWKSLRVDDIDNVCWEKVLPEGSTVWQIKTNDTECWLRFWNKSKTKKPVPIPMCTPDQLIPMYEFGRKLHPQPWHIWVIKNYECNLVGIIGVVQKDCPTAEIWDNKNSLIHIVLA